MSNRDSAIVADHDGMPLLLAILHLPNDFDPIDAFRSDQLNELCLSYFLIVACRVCFIYFFVGKDAIKDIGKRSEH